MQNCEQKFLKHSSLLDYTYPGLNPLIWLQDGTLNPVHKDFVLKLLNSFYSTYELKSPEQWVTDITLIGSLTTNKYLLNKSDFDCHVVVDIDKFIETNLPKASKEKAIEYLDEARKTWDRAKILMPFTSGIVLELYFESDLNPSNTEHVGRYSLLQNKWLKEPVYFAQDEDFEESRKNTIEEAKALANELDSSFGEVARSIQRIEELTEVAKAWPNDKRKLFYDKIQKKLDIIEEELEKSIAIKQDLVDTRHKQQDAFSDIEIKFKFLSRFHYFAILQELKAIMESTGGEVTTEELPLIEKVISQASIKQAAEYQSYWVDPKGQIFECDGTHASWVSDNQEMLNNEYGMKLGFKSDRFKGLDEDSEEYQEAVDSILNEWTLELVQHGWVRVFVGDELGIQIADINNPPSYMEGPFIQFASETKGAIVINDLHENAINIDDQYGFVKGIKKGLQQKRLQSSMQKFASFMKKAGSVLDVNGVRVYKDPTRQQVENLFNNGSLRVILDPKANDLYIWDAYYLAHVPVMDALGIEYSKETYEDYTWDITSKSDIDYTFERQNKNKLQPAVSLKKANGDIHSELNNKILVDFDGTIAQDMPDHSIGEPMNGAKEALQKLKELGYELEIFSSRANDENGLEEIKEYLDKHVIPYDSIFQGEKPLAKYYIDNSSIHFDNWNNVLKQIEKSKKKASLRIVAAQWPDAFYISPTGKLYPVQRTHDEWVVANTELLKKEYDLDLRGAYGDAFDASVGDIMDALLTYGWTRGAIAANHKDYVAQVNAIQQVPNVAIDFFLAGPDNIKLTIEDASESNFVTVTKDDLLQGQKGINKAFRMQRNSKLFSKKEIKAQTKKVKQGEYSAIMAVVPHDIAQEIVEWGVRNIKDKDVFSDKENPRLGRELEPHITVKYGLLTDDIKSVRQFFNDAKPFKAKLGKVKHFEPIDMEFDVVTVEVVSEDLERMNKEVTEHFECAEGLVSDEYHPHITVSYVGRGKGKDYIGSSEFEGKEITLDTLIVSPRKGNRTYFSISNDKESRFVLEKINKIASLEHMWVDPSGNIYNTEGNTHYSWINDNLEMLEREYGFKVPKRVWKQRMRYYELVEEQGDEDNVELPDVWEVESDMFSRGWVRIGDSSGNSIGVELENLRSIPSFLDNIFSKFINNGEIIDVEDHNDWVRVTYPFKSLQQAVNKALSSPTKTASGNNFYPSLVQAPNNQFQFENGGDDQEIPVDPDAVSDEETFYAPCTVGKPRNPDMWKSLWHMIKSPFSKKEVKKESYKSYEAYLLSPSGETIPNGDNSNEDHVDTAKRVLHKPLAKLISEGWSTVRIVDGNAGFAVQSLDSIPSSVDDFISKNSITSIAVWPYNGNLGNLVEPPSVSYEDAIEHGIQKSINRSIIEQQQDLQKQSSSDPEQEAIEQKELGGETLLEYSKGFKDLNRLDTNKPKTTWDNPNPRSGEPYSPLPVTYDTVTNEMNENWRFPYKFTRRPVGDQSDDGKTIEMLQEQEKRKACIERITREITATSGMRAWIDPEGKVHDISPNPSHKMWVYKNLVDPSTPLYQVEDAVWKKVAEMFDAGWTRVSTDSNNIEASIVLEVQDLRRLPNYLDNFIAEHYEDRPIELGDSNGKVVLIEDPFPSIQKAVNKALQRKRLGKKVADLPPQQFIPEHLNASTAFQTDDGSIYWSDEPHMIHVKLIKQLGIPVERIVSGGRIVDGDYHDLGPRSDTMRYVEREMARKRIEEKRKAFSKKAALEWNQRFFKYWKNENKDFLNDYDTLNNFLGQETQNLPNKEIDRLLYIHGEDLFHEKVRDLQSLGNQFPIYRVITIKDIDAFLKALKSNKFEGFSGVGVYWSYDPTAAEAHWGKFESGYQIVRLTAIVHSSEIDWEVTILANMNLSLGEQEKEITLLDGAALQVNSVEINGKVIQTSFPVTASLNKKAGSYSASVPDYQGEQYYNEQHMDNGGETAYTNWDAIGNGVWDFNQNTNDFPQQKDMQPQTVFLDILNKPFNRKNPFGMDWYQVQWFDSTPAQNGAEVMNPD